MTTDTDNIRQLITSYTIAFQSRDREALAKVLDEDVEWHPPKGGVFEGRVIKGREELLDIFCGPNQLFNPDTYRIDIDRIIVETNTAVVIQTLSAETHTGLAYNNKYCWVYTIIEGRVSRLDEFTDTHRSWLFLQDLQA